MKLDKIILNGFKSFADKTEFEFGRGITAIVGPNGCGKSNIVDAVKWVLGNQSPKSLRSDQMADVIFSGSSSRKPSSMAEVTLCFSGVNGFAIEQNELEIGRRLYKNGESTYLINNKSCRLKDIRELFMDTGVGVSAYSIIEQGQIEQLLHASRVDRRLIFEEAAGISKYKAHKKEALRKLERTEQNLLRLADIVSEVQRQLRSIKLQAGKARNYLTYSQRLKELRVNYSLAEYNKIVTQNKSKQDKLNRYKDKFSVVVAEVGRADTSVSELGRTILDTENEINRWDNLFVAAKSKIEQQLERIEFLKGRVDELRERKSSATEQIRKLDEQTAEFARSVKRCGSELEENQCGLAARNKELEALRQEINAINHDCGSIEADLEDEKSGIIDTVRRTALLHNDIQSISTYRSKMSDQKDKLSGRANVAKEQLADMLTEKAQYEGRLGEAGQVISDLQENLDAKRNQMAENDTAQARISEELAQKREKRSALASEVSVLSDMEARREGLSSSVKEILARHAEGSEALDYVEGIVADVIRADVEHAIAVEAALEGKADALVVNSTHRFLEDKVIHRKLKSRVKVICTDRVEPFVDTEDFSAYPEVIGRAVEFVSYDSKHAGLVWKLLGHTILVDSIDSAIKLARKLPGKYRFVTMTGQVFDGDNCISIGPVGKGIGLISRKSRLTQIEKELVGISIRTTQITEKLAAGTQQNEHLTKLCKDFRTAIYEANTEKVDTESRVRLIEQSIKSLTDEQPIITSEIEILDEEISQSVKKEYDSKEKLEELESINTQRSERISQLEEKLAQKKQQQQHYIAELTELKVLIGQMSEKQSSIQQRISSLQSQLQQGRMALESARTDMLSFDDQITQTERSILDSESQVSELYVEKEKTQQMSKHSHDKSTQLRAQQQRDEETLRAKRTEQSEIEQQMHEAELSLSQLTVKSEDLVQRVMEELGMDLEEAYADFQQQEMDWDAVRDEITELRGKIERLGNVNVEAIKEQESLEQRYEFLASQTEDLNKSRGQLEQLINKLNKESREKFRVTFEEVRINFQQIFRKLFGGGKADIILEDPNDILESGIEIIARPPGKETRSISLLSGGEKTLTALGLLFAVFKSKPSPFCILDEVDAALDESNNERFNLLVQEFQKHSQFITITHAKRTMSIADVLFGITMQTRGVSKKISVQFDGADVEAEPAVA